MFTQFHVIKAQLIADTKSKNHQFLCISYILTPLYTQKNKDTESVKLISTN